MRVYLKVPFSYKDEAKHLGARFDMSCKLWFVPDGTDVEPFKKWIPLHHVEIDKLVSRSIQHSDEFQRALDKTNNRTARRAKNIHGAS